MSTSTGRERRAKPKSDAFGAVHEIARALHTARVINKKTMREYDEFCLKPVKPVSPTEVARIRHKAKLSQNLFARYLNTSPSTVQKWETGAKRPSGPAAKLLRVVERHGVKVLS